MKTSFVIRIVAAAVVATLASLGFLAVVTGSAVLFSLSWLLLIPRGELTRPIPRSEWWLMFVVVGVLLAVFLTMPFLRLPPAPSERVRIAVAVPLWLLWMWAIYRRWQREKGKADA